MGNNQHLKRHSAPTSWPIKRKNITFTTKPNPGSHKLDYATCVLVIIRDILKYAETAKEAKLVVHNKDVLVNGKKIIDVKYPVGIFDVLEVKDSKEKYVVLFDEFGKLKLVAVNDDLIYLKVSKKSITPGKKFQLNFMNGFNVLVDEKTFKSISVADTVLFDLSKKKVSSVLNLKEGAQIYFFDGKFKGHFGEIKGFVNYNGLTRDKVQVEVAGETHTTAKDYCFVVGSKKADVERFK